MQEPLYVKTGEMRFSFTIYCYLAIIFEKWQRGPKAKLSAPFAHTTHSPTLNPSDASLIQENHPAKNVLDLQISSIPPLAISLYT